MCEADAYLIQGEREEKLLENVDTLDIRGQEITIINIFGEQKTMRGRFKSYNAGERKILLERIM